eukprot:scaffold13037_cov63-Phaeocystis_antarctica.AAC.2
MASIVPSAHREQLYPREHALTAGCPATVRPYLAPTVRRVGASRSLHVLPRCPQARVPQLQPAGEQKRFKCAIGLPQALVRKHTPGSGTGAHGRNR